MQNKYLEKIAGFGIPGLPNIGKAVIGMGSKIARGIASNAANAAGRGYTQHAQNITGITNPSKLMKFNGGFAGNRALVNQVKTQHLSSTLTGTAGRQANRDAIAKIRGIPTRSVIPKTSADGKVLGLPGGGVGSNLTRGTKMNDLKTQQTTGRLVTGGTVLGAGLLAKKVSDKASEKKQMQYYN